MIKTILQIDNGLFANKTWIERMKNAYPVNHPFSVKSFQHFHCNCLPTSYFVEVELIIWNGVLNFLVIRKALDVAFDYLLYTNNKPFILTNINFEEMATWLNVTLCHTTWLCYLITDFKRRNLWGLLDLNAFYKALKFT